MIILQIMNRGEGMDDVGKKCFENRRDVLHLVPFATQHGEDVFSLIATRVRLHQRPVVTLNDLKDNEGTTRSTLRSWLYTYSW